jgi:hypothetical protein
VIVARSQSTEGLFHFHAFPLGDHTFDLLDHDAALERLGELLIENAGGSPS